MYKPFIADGNRANLNSEEKTGFDNLGIDAEDYNFSSIAEGSLEVYAISSEKATEFANAVSNSNLLGNGGIFALIEDNNSKSGFSVQKITVGDIALVHFEDKGESNSDFLSNDTDFILNIDGTEPFTSVLKENRR